jgi:hypothetical protein
MAVEPETQAQLAAAYAQQPKPESQEDLATAYANQPNSGLAPAAGGPASQPMQKSNVGIALGSENEGIANPQQPAEQFALQNPAQQGKLATASVIGAAGAALPVAASFAAPMVEHISGQILEHGAELATKYPNFVKLAGKLVPGLELSALGALTYAYEHFKK